MSLRNPEMDEYQQCASHDSSIPAPASGEMRRRIALELGDVLCAVARLAQLYGLKMSDIARMNVQKLKRRTSNNERQETVIYGTPTECQEPTTGADVGFSNDLSEVSHVGDPRTEEEDDEYIGAEVLTAIAYARGVVVGRRLTSKAGDE